MRLVVSGGGTGGHVYPAIAVASRIVTGSPGSDVTYIGSEAGPEKAAAHAAGLRFEGLRVSGVIGKSPGKALAALFRFAVGSVRCLRLFVEMKPQVVLSTGGYASAPACLAAVLTGTPLVLHEMNFDPGIVVRVFSRFATVVATAFEGTSEKIAGGTRCVVTGVPVRPEIEALSSEEEREVARQEARAEFGLERGRTTLLVFGGSQGAQALNRATWNSIRRVSDGQGLQVLHLTGPKHSGEPDCAEAERLARQAGALYRPVPYTEKMHLAYAAADLAVARSGAGTVAELAAARLPAVLVPFPFSAGGHQEENAHALAAGEAAVVVPQEGDSADRALERARELLRDPARLQAMKGAARQAPRESAAEGIARLLEEVS